MIDVATLDESCKGRGVTYVHRHGRREFGTISSWNETYIFVRFGHGVAAMACYPSDLEWTWAKGEHR
jgi:hypothetical protein